jgi:hypothetical protein
MFKKQGTSKRSASTSIGDIKPGFHEATPTDMGSQASAFDMAWASEELLELDEVQLATVVGGVIPRDEVIPRYKGGVNGPLWGGYESRYAYLQAGRGIFIEFVLDW